MANDVVPRDNNVLALDPQLVQHLLQLSLAAVHVLDGGLFNRILYLQAVHADEYSELCIGLPARGHGEDA